MNGSPRDFPEWTKQIERQVKSSARGAMRAVTEVRDDVGVVKEDLGAIREELENIPGAATPAAPVEMTAESALYINREGRLVARVTINFPDVLFTTTGQPLTVTSYELLGYESTAMPLQDKGAAYPSAAFPGSTYPGTPQRTRGLEPVWAPLATSPVSGFILNDLTPGQGWMFRVRAANGVWSAPFRVETLRDTTPPPMPTAPSVEHVRGTLVVRWDGMAVTGAMPLDFDHVILAGGPNPSPTNELYRFGTSGGTFVVPGVDYYETWFFRLRAVDQSGNVSTWSEQVSEYPRPMVDRDIILTELDAARTHLKNVNAGVSILPDTIITEHLRVTTDMSAAIGRFLEVDADMLKANDIWADNAWLGYAEAALVKADMFIGREFIGGTFTGTTFRTNPADDRGVILDDDGLKAFDPAGQRTFLLDSATGDLTARGTFRTGEPGRQVSIIEVGAQGGGPTRFPGVLFEHPNLPQDALIAIDVGADGGGGTLTLWGGRGQHPAPHARLALGAFGNAMEMLLAETPTTPRFRLEQSGVVQLVGRIPAQSFTGAMFQSGETGGLTGPLHPNQHVEWTIPALPQPDGRIRMFYSIDSRNGDGGALTVEGFGSTLNQFQFRLHNAGTAAATIWGVHWFRVRGTA